MSNLDVLASLWESAEMIGSIVLTLGLRNSLIKFLILCCLHSLWISTIEQRNLSSLFFKPGNSFIYFSLIFSFRSCKLVALLFLVKTGCWEGICSFDILGTDAEDSSLISVIFFSSSLLMKRFSYSDWFACSFARFILVLAYLLVTYIFFFSSYFSIIRTGFDFTFFFSFGSLE